MMICTRSSLLYVFNLWDDANSYFTVGKCIFRGFVPYRDLFDQLRRRGYTEVRIDGEILDLQGVDALDRYKVHFIELVVDRLKPEAGDDRRIRDSVGS